MLKINWSSLYRNRMQVVQRYKSIWSIPIIKKEMVLLTALIRPDTLVLEMGAGDRRFERKLRKIYPSLGYKSFDIDPDTVQDFHSADSIEGTYDLIFCFEVIEHLTPDEGLELLQVARRHLRPEGRILIGTPNLYHPHRYFGDLTHKTPYKYEELGGLMILAGFNIPSMYRMFNAPLISRLFRLYVGSWLHRYLDIDFCHTVLAEATLPEVARQEGNIPNE